MRKAVVASVLMSVVFALLIMAGCAKKEKVVAKVGRLNVTVKELDQVFPKRPYASFDEELQKKRERLDMLIEEKIYLNDAYEKNLDKDTTIIQAVERDKRGFLMNVLYDKVVASVVKITDEEIKNYYESLKEEVSARHILVNDEKLADSVYNLVMQDTSDANFAKIAQIYSNDPGTKDKGGDLGFFKRGRMIQEFENAAFALKIGEISKPVKTPYGYHIIKLTGRRTVEQPPFETMKNDLERELKMRKERERTSAFLDSIKNAAGLTLTDGFKNIQAKLSAENPLTLSANEESVVVATYKYGNLKANDLKRIWDYTPSYKRSEIIANPEKIKEALFNDIQMTLLEKVASEIGIEKTPEYKERYKRALEQEMVRAYKDKFVYANIQVTTDEIKQYYDTHQDEFKVEPRVQVKEIQVATKDEALKLLKQAKKGNFEALADKYTLRTYTKGRGGDLGLFPRARFPELFDAAQKMKEGEVGGPVEMGGRYSIIKVVKKEPESIKTFEEVQRMIENKIRMEKRKAAEQAWLEDAKKRIKIKVYDDVLKESIDASKYQKQTPASTPPTGPQS